MPIGLTAPHLAGAGKAADDLVGDEQDVVLAQDRLDLLEIALRRKDRPAGSHDGLGEKGGDGVGPFRLDERLERLGHAGRKLRLALARLMAAVVMGKLGVLERRERQAEAGVHVRLARETDGGAGVAVVSHPARDDLGSLRLADGVPIIPGELDGGVVRLRARALEDDAGHRHRRDPEQLLGKRDRRLGRAVAIEVVVAELAHLLVGDLGEPLGAETERGAPQPGHRLDVVAAGIVEHPTALAARNHQRALLLVLAQVGLHVHEACDVARLDRVRNIGHAASSDAAAFRSASGSAMP